MEIDKVPPQPALNSGLESSGQSQAKHWYPGNQKESSPLNPRTNPEIKIEVKVETGDFARVEQDKIRLEQAAKSIRNKDQTLESIDVHLEDMESLLATYVKQYPPFPPDSRQKADLIKQFNALWHLIEKLTLSPPADSPDTKPATETAGPDDSPANGLKPGYRLPITPLAPEASDRHLQESLNSVKKARTLVAEQRRILALRAARISAGI